MRSKPPSNPIEQQHVVRTSAASALINKPKGAQSSVFDVARGADQKAPRTRMTTLDAAKVVIRHNAPIPAPNRGTGVSVYTELWARMKKGDCAELPDRQALGLATFARKKKYAFTVRRIGAGIKGVWRTA
jgi:hypothetical protein